MSIRQRQAASLNIGGWYDIFLGSTLRNYVNMRNVGGSDLARDNQRPVLGPSTRMN